ncbi:uncharacterized protein LOC134205172 isoform X2 [Armigeres subalbatus]|uniref:uncharacterized protein LOC134205172 isoform X2 n=1 Tax=Armigeres subalbatus TaxID=124917 RepID=UPI002ED01D56
MGERNRLLPISVAVCLVLYATASVNAFNFDDDLEDLIAEESIADEEIYGDPILPSNVFNGGKPFYVERDPSTGAIDFNHKKTVNQIDVDDKGTYDTKDSHVSDTKDVIVSQSSPNFHDFLNLPVKYSSSNFVYPLISSSYANLKYQGSNKVSNHKNVTSTPSTTTAAPKFQFTRPQYTTAKLETTRTQLSTTTSQATQPSSRYTYPTTSGRPITTTTTTTTTELPITTVPAKQLFTRYPYKSTIKNKYLETTEMTRKKFFLPSTLSLPTTTTTQRPHITELQTTPIRSSTFYSPSIRPWTSPSSTQPVTTTSESITESRPANPIRFEDHPSQTLPEEDTANKIKFTIPALKYEGNRPAPFRPLPPSHIMLNRKNETSNKIDLPNDPAVMSLSDIFNSLGLDDKQAAAEEKENSIVFETTISQTTEQTTPPAIVLIPEHKPIINQEGPKIEQSIDLTDQYVKYDIQQSNGHRPQKPSNDQYDHYEVYQSNGHRPQSPPNDNNFSNQYVKYEVQQPQINLIKYGSVPSMNSVVISPNQHSATFVLGSQQSVGSSNDGHFVSTVSQEPTSAALSSQPAGYQMGQVLDEPNENSNVQVGTSVNVQVKPQDIIKTTSVRFPSESDDKYENAPIISGTHKSEVLPPNGHSAPIGVGSNAMVVFPKNDQIESTLHEVSNRIVFDTPNNEALNKNEISSFTPDLPEQLTPPSKQDNTQLLKRPRPPMSAQGPPFIYKEIQRRPFPGGVRPPQLPNILPQFRPNAKISHGHPPYHKEAGNFRIPPQQPGKNLPPNGPPRKPFTDPAAQLPPTSTLAIRRSPVPTRFMTRMNSIRPPPPPPQQMEVHNENRRYYRLPPPMLKDRVFHIAPQNLKPPPPPGPSQASRFAESYAPPTPEKSSVPNRNPEESPNNEFQRDPPTILKNTMSDDKPQRPKLEPVVTLQMLQSKKQTEQSKHKLPSGQKIDLAIEGQPPTSSPQAANIDGKQPVYVVYPVKSTPMNLDSIHAGSNIDPVVVGHHGEQPLMTPPPEPILMAKDKKQHPKLHFPYNIEKPDPYSLIEIESESKNRVPEFVEKKPDTVYNIGEEPVSKEQPDDSVISTKLQRVTESTPIAIAYTPTESNQKYNYIKHPNSPYYSPYGETQTEVSYLKMDDFDEFGNPAHHYEHNFQAPFQASISLDPVKVTNPYEGWAVVTSSPQALVKEQNKIDRSDDHHSEENDVSTNKPSEKGGFQPELQGGFRPIYAEDVKLSELMNPDPQSKNAFFLESESEPERPKKHESKQTQEKAEHIERKPDRKPILDSLEAFFDNLTKDYDENTETTGLGDEMDVDESTAKTSNELEGRSNDNVISEINTDEGSTDEPSSNKQASNVKEESSKE